MDTTQKIAALESYLWQQCQQLQYALSAKPMNPEEYRAAQQSLATCEQLHEQVFLKVLPY